MEQARHSTGVAPRRAEAGRMALAAARFALRAAFVVLPLVALRALLRPREARASSLSDRQLADIGLTRSDVAPRERPGRAELDVRWRQRGWERL